MKVETIYIIYIDDSSMVVVKFSLEILKLVLLIELMASSTICFVCVTCLGYCDIDLLSNLCKVLVKPCSQDSQKDWSINRSFCSRFTLFFGAHCSLSSCVVVTYFVL